MGLELVEIVMEVEETFDISVPDDDTGGIATPSDLCDVVFKRLRERDAYPCLSANVFYRLRRAFTEAAGTNRADFRPDVSLTELLPRRRRNELWSMIGCAAALGVPSLSRPRWMFWAGCFLLFVLLPLICVLTTVRYAIPLSAAVTLASMSLAATWILLRALTRSFVICLPKGCETVGGAVRTVVDHNYGRAESRSIAWEEEQVWAKVREIIAETSGVETAKVTRRAHLVRDLGCG